MCGFEGRPIAHYQGHWEPVLSSILVMVWVFKPARSNTFWVLLLQNPHVFYQNVSSNAYNTNLYTPSKRDDSFWVAQFFSHPVILSETSSLPRKRSTFINNTRSSVHIMARVGRNHKSSLRILVSDQNFAAIKQKALLWYKRTLPVQICSKKVNGGLT